jgi:hypothetical protein
MQSILLAVLVLTSEMNSKNSSTDGSNLPSDDRSQRRVDRDSNNIRSGGNTSSQNSLKHRRGYQISNTHHPNYSNTNERRFRRGQMMFLDHS